MGGVDRRRFLAVTAAPLVLGGVPEAFARPLSGRRLALVTADLEASVVALDLTTGRVVRRLRTPADPRSIEGVGFGGALVAHTALGRLSYVDSRLRVREVDGTLGEPRYTAVAAPRRLAYVSDSGRREIAVVDVAALRVVARLRVPGPVRHLSLDRTGTRLWAVLGNVSPTVAVVDTSRPREPRLLGTVRPPFAAHDVGFTPGGRRVWLTSGDRERLAIHDAATGRLVRTLRGDAPPQHVTFLDDRAYVASGDDGLLRVHRLDGHLLRTTRIPVGSYNVQSARRAVLTPSLSQGTISVLSDRGAVRLRRQVARSSHDACVVVVPAQ